MPVIAVLIKMFFMTVFLHWISKIKVNVVSALRFGYFCGRKSTDCSLHKHLPSTLNSLGTILIIRDTVAGRANNDRTEESYIFWPLCTWLVRS